MSRGHRGLGSSRSRQRRRVVGGVVILAVLLLMLEFVELIHLHR
jgi:hypothetical protein